MHFEEKDEIMKAWQKTVELSQKVTTLKEGVAADKITGKIDDDVFRSARSVGFDAILEMSQKIANSRRKYTQDLQEAEDFALKSDADAAKEDCEKCEKSATDCECTDKDEDTLDEGIEDIENVDGDEDENKDNLDNLLGEDGEEDAELGLDNLDPSAVDDIPEIGGDASEVTILKTSDKAKAETLAQQIEGRVEEANGEFLVKVTPVDTDGDGDADIDDVVGDPNAPEIGGDEVEELGEAEGDEQGSDLERIKAELRKAIDGGAEKSLEEGDEELELGDELGDEGDIKLDGVEGEGESELGDELGDEAIKDPADEIEGEEVVEDDAGGDSLEAIKQKLYKYLGEEDDLDAEFGDLEDADEDKLPTIGDEDGEEDLEDVDGDEEDEESLKVVKESTAYKKLMKKLKGYNKK